MHISRRGIIAGGAASAIAAMNPPESVARGNDFSFVHITDLHIQPELGATAGVAKAFAAIRNLPERPDFALVGGDLVMDANKVSPDRAAQVYDLFCSAAAELGLPLYYSIGNHDGFGLGMASSASAAALQNPDFGKGMWRRRLGMTNTYGAFDHKGWRFATLDSLSFGPDGSWEGVIDPDQLKWLDDLLRNTPVKMPVVLLTHMPMLTIYGQYTAGATSAMPAQLIVKNGKEVQELIQGRNVRAVFQGHTHVLEECTYLGTRYITGGAICGDWWKGWRLGVHPEGFTVASVRNGELNWRYVPFGWDAKAFQALK